MSTARVVRRSTTSLLRAARTTTRLTAHRTLTITPSTTRLFSSAPRLRIGLTEASDDKQNSPAKESEPHEALPTEPTPLTDEEYHERSDMYLDALVAKLEAAAEEKESGGVDVEFAVRFFPPKLVTSAGSRITFHG